MIRCKFKVDEVAQTTYGEKLLASPVYKTSKENAEFWEATPSGSLSVSCVKSGTFACLAPGTEFYLNLQPISAEDQEASKQD